jgi:hypothetical protein
MNRTRLMGRIWVFGLLAAGLTFFAADARAQEPERAPVCEIEVPNPVVPVQAEAVTLNIKLPEDIGAQISARLAEGSGVQVVSVERPAGAPAPGAVSLVLNTANAVAGSWELTVEDENGRSCKGTIQVQAAEGQTR